MEVKNSFERHPFIHGYYCHLDRGMYSDGWVSGSYNGILQKYVKELKLHIPGKQNLNNMSTDGEKIVIDEYSISQKNEILRMYGANIDIEKSSKKILIETDSCYSPRDLGHSVDSRLLGAKIEFIF